MKIIVNNEEINTSSTHLQDLAEELHLPENGVAIAVNNRMISRIDWKAFKLEELQQIVIIKAVCGG